MTFPNSQGRPQIIPSDNSHSLHIKQKNILLLEDDPLIIEGMHFLLTDWGYQNITFFKYDQIYQNQESEQFAISPFPDLILADLDLGQTQLPNDENVSTTCDSKIDGLHIAQKIRCNSGVQIPVLIITGVTESRKLQRMTESGFLYLHKPVLPSKLKQVIEMLLGHESCR